MSSHKTINHITKSLCYPLLSKRMNEDKQTELGIIREKSPIKKKER